MLSISRSTHAVLPQPVGPETIAYNWKYAMFVFRPLLWRAINWLPQIYNDELSPPPLGFFCLCDWISTRVQYFMHACSSDFVHYWDMKLSPSLMHNRPTRPIDATTRQQISVYSILIGICLLVPRTCNKNCTAQFFQMWGVQKNFFARESRFVPPLLKPWRRPRG